MDKTTMAFFMLVFSFLRVSHGYGRNGPGEISVFQAYPTGSSGVNFKTGVAAVPGKLNVFVSTRLNLGGHYKRLYSEYIAPVDGLYEFYLQCARINKDAYLELSVILDYDRILDCVASDVDNVDQTANHAYVELAKGSVVSVSLRSANKECKGKCMMAYLYSVFSGALLEEFI